MTETTRGVLKAAHQRMGFLTEDDVRSLAVDPSTRLALVLLRCHEGRALVPAQDCASFVAAVEKAGWCVRDVSFPSGGPLETAAHALAAGAIGAAEAAITAGVLR